MKKIFIFNTILIILGMFLIAQEYYRSNPLGMQFERIGPDGLTEYPYVLKIEQKGDVRSETLFKDKEEVERTEQVLFPSGELKTEREYRKGELIRTRKYRSDGLIQHIEEYEEGELTGIFTYRYSGKTLSSIELTEEGGEKVYTDYYRYTLDGFLRQIKREFPDGSYRISHYRYADDSLITEWHKKNPAAETPAKTVVSHYNSKGNLVKQTSYRSGEKISSTEYIYKEEGKGELEQTIHIGPERIRTVRTFGADGSLVEEVVERDEETISEVRYIYEEGLLKRKTVLREGVEERMEYRYDEEGTLYEEAYYREDALLVVTRYTESDSYQEDIYDEEELVLRVYYQKGKVIKKEVFKDGEVIRSRN
jgi:antitoxin component YwqK of YwqJK toxin-antitoxin module